MLAEPRGIGVTDDIGGQGVVVQQHGALPDSGAV